MKRRISMKKSGGFTLIETVLVIAFFAVLIGFIFSQVPNFKFQYDRFLFNLEHKTVVSGVETWKKGRTNFKSLTISAVCTAGDLPVSVCGTSNDGKGTNRFGGDWTVGPNKVSNGVYNVTATLPFDGGRIANIADSLAGSTRANCEVAKGCATLSTTATSITTVH